jgi:Tol biopolymer transport system component
VRGWGAMTVRRRVAVGVVAVVVGATALGGCARPWGVELVSVNAHGTDSGAGWSGDGPVSFVGDGTKVLFVSRAGDLGPTDTNGQDDVYIRDLVSGTTSLVSVNEAGTDSGNGSSGVAQASEDGTKVAFISTATDLGPHATRPGIYVRDLVTGETTLATVDASGADSSDGFLWHFRISPDGTKVLWPTMADDLGPTDHDRPSDEPEPTNDAADTDVYVRDLAAGTTALVSVNAAGTDSGDKATESAWFGPDATTVLFHSGASDLVAGDTNGAVDAFERDLTTGVTTRIELSPTASVVPQYSADGATIAFSTPANDLGPTDSDCSAAPHPWPPTPRRCSDVYVRDLTTGETTLVSHDATGTDSADGDSTLVALSPDGNRVLFESWAGDLGPADAGYDVDLYLHDRTTGTTSLVTVNAGGSDGLDSGDYQIYSAVSADLTRVAFGTMATNLGPSDTNGAWDVYVRDLTAGTTVLVSHAVSGGGPGNGASLPWAFSPDGRRLLFTSSASDLVAADTNGSQDLFLATPARGRPGARPTPGRPG